MYAYYNLLGIAIRAVGRVLPYSFVIPSGPGIAAGYGLDVSGMESRWGARFSAPVQTDPRGPTQPLVQWVQGISRG